MLLLLVPLAAAREIALQNDALPDDGAAEEAALVALGYADCAVILLDPPADVVYPLSVRAVRLLLGTTAGTFENGEAQLSLAIQAIKPAEVPEGLYGYAEWSWPEEAFWVTISSTYLNELALDDGESGLFPLVLDEPARLAVYVCGPDPDLGGPWPYASEEDYAGLAVHTASAGEGSYLLAGGELAPLAERGIAGSWVIRAIAEDAREEEPAAAPPALALGAIAPGDAALGAAAEVTITGEGFDESAEVAIGGLPLTAPILVDEGTITGRSPSGLPAGSHDVVVSRGDGQSAELIEAFAVADAAGPGCGCGAARSGGGGAAGLIALIAAFSAGPRFPRRRSSRR